MGAKQTAQVVKPQLLAGKLVHRVLPGRGRRAVHAHFVLPGLRVIAELGLVALLGCVGDLHLLGFRHPFQGVFGPGAVIRKAEEGLLIRVAQPHARLLCRGADLLAGGELGMLIGHLAATGVPMGGQPGGLACQNSPCRPGSGLRSRIR